MSYSIVFASHKTGEFQGHTYDNVQMYLRDTEVTVKQDSYGFIVRDVKVKLETFRAYIPQDCLRFANYAQLFEYLATHYLVSDVAYDQWGRVKTMEFEALKSQKGV